MWPSLMHQQIRLEDLSICLASCHNQEFCPNAVLVWNYECVRSSPELKPKGELGDLKEFPECSLTKLGLHPSASTCKSPQEDAEEGCLECNDCFHLSTEA